MALPNSKGFSQPPSIFVWNIGGTKWKQTNDGPWENETLLQCFINTLKTIESHEYSLHGATFSHEGANIFIETNDELWNDRVEIHKV